MDRKIHIWLVAIILLATVPTAGAQQQPKIPRIGFLASFGAGPDPRSEALRQGLRDLGYAEGKNITIEYRYAAGDSDRLIEFAAEFVRLKVDVIILSGSTIAVRAAKDLTKTIPIVMTGTGDPVGTGLVAKSSLTPAETSRGYLASVRS